MSYEKQNFEDGQVLKAEHLNKMDDELTRAKNWAELEGKPVKQEAIGDTLTWDGNTEGLVCAADAFYKVSDVVLTADELANGCTSKLQPAEGEVFELSVTGEEIATLPGGVLALPNAFSVPAEAVGVDIDGLVFTEPGLYFVYIPEDSYVAALTIPGYTFTKEVISPDHIPEHSHEVGWKSVSGKPFVTVGGDTLEWDGNTEGLVCAADAFYKVSDVVLTADELANGCTSKLQPAEGEVFELSVTGEEIATLPGGVLALPNAFSVPAEAVGVDIDGLVFTEPGLYFVYIPEDSYVAALTIPGYTGFTKEQIDPAVLPEVKWDEIGGKKVVVVGLNEEFALDHTPAEIEALINAGIVCSFSLTGTPFVFAMTNDKLTELKAVTFPNCVKVSDSGATMETSEMVFDLATGAIVGMNSYRWTATVAMHS